MLHDVQARFRAAIVGGDDAPLLGLVDGPAGVSLARRIAVHRNTYFGSLIEALAAAYPVAEWLVGSAFFRAAARRFIEASPPRKPDLAGYGGGFGAFLDAFPPAASLPYLGDVGRLEWARVEATFAADAEPLDPAGLGTTAPEDVGRLVFTLHPTARLVASAWPVQTIWDAHKADDAGLVDLNAGGETVLVVRPRERMLALRLDGAEHAFLAALADGRTLADAAEAAGPHLDLMATLGRHLGEGTFAAARVAG